MSCAARLTSAAGKEGRLAPLFEQLSNRQQQITAELLLSIQPGPRPRKSSFTRQLRNVRQIVLVRVLGMDLLTLCKFHYHLKLANRDSLRARTLNVDLDPAQLFVIVGVMLERA